MKWKVGAKVWFTGDMANASCSGTITKYYPRGRYNMQSVDITFDDDRYEGDTRKSRMVPVLLFNPGPGRRFWFLEEWNTHCQAQLEAFANKYKEE